MSVDDERSLRSELAYSPWACLLCRARFFTMEDVESHFLPGLSRHPEAAAAQFTEAVDRDKERHVQEALRGLRLRWAAQRSDASLEDCAMEPAIADAKKTSDNDYGKIVSMEITPKPPDNQNESCEVREMAHTDVVEVTISDSDCSSEVFDEKINISRSQKEEHHPDDLPEPKESSSDSESMETKSMAAQLQMTKSRGKRRLRVPCTCPNCVSGANLGSCKRHTCHVHGCGKSYGRVSHLRGHLNVHLESRPFQCNWPGCGKGFTRSDELKRHRNKHTGEELFACPHCRRHFSRRDNLSKHMNTHKDTNRSRLLPIN